MLTLFLEHINQEKFFPEGKSILLAVSGGIDSMVLLHLFEQSNLDFSVAHFDHLTRKGDSTLDAEFVKQYCYERSIQFHLSQMEADHQSNNFQAEARRQRYKFFGTLNYDVLVTAHHKDDRVETIFMNIVQGKSIKGIPEKKIDLVRPLLIFSRSQIEVYAELNKLKYRVDDSNFENYYLRNKVRNELLPILQTTIPHVKNRIIGLSEKIEEEKDLLSTLVQDLLKPVEKKQIIEVFKDKLNQSSASAYDILKVYLSQYGFTDTQALNVSNSLKTIGAYFQSYTHELIIDRSSLIIKKLSSSVDTNITIDNIPIDEEQYELDGFKYVLTVQDNFKIEESEDIFQCNLEKIMFPIHIRYWQSGDRFAPLGMEGKTKSLKKLLTDLKLNRFEKSKQHVLVDANGTIMWVCGIRSDDKFKLTDPIISVLTLRRHQIDSE